MKPDTRRPDAKRPARPTAKPDGLAPRRAALSLYLAVTRDGRPLDDAFADMVERGALQKLSPRDRAFARRLATTGVRRRGQALALLAGLLNKGGVPAKAQRLEALLVLGVAELLFLATPPHAALDCAVSLAREDAETGGFAGLVNAVLRRASREFAAPEALAHLAPLTANLPDWLRARWARTYGDDMVASFAAALSEEPPLDITPAGDPAPWIEPLEATRLPTGTLRRALGGRIDGLPGFAEGAWWVQDAAAALPATLLGDVAGSDVLDLCAAPGGKTLQLAARGARVTAIDKDARRLARLRENLARLRLGATVVDTDILSWRAPAPYPFVLLDAPCSATGTLRRHPDVAWLKSARDLPGLVSLQSALLDAAVSSLAPGGTLVYAVCSLEPEEGPAQIASALERHPALVRRPMTAREFPALENFLTPDGDLRTTPAHWAELGGLDGFYAARLVRP